VKPPLFIYLFIFSDSPYFLAPSPPRFHFTNFNGTCARISNHVPIFVLDEELFLKINYQQCFEFRVK
jgi:hypothetical protein